MRPPELRRMFQQYDRMVESDLRKDRLKLFRGLEEFANIRPDKEGWAHFRKRWPDFFPSHQYDAVAENSTRSIFGYPLWLNQIWAGGETEPALHILLGIDPNPEKTEGTPEEAWFSHLVSIPAQFYADWQDGIFRYQGGCDFQRALYLLFRESWRARFCEKCNMKFIARRAAQKYCTTDCSEKMQRELKLKWWTNHGETWRKKRKRSKLKKRGGKNGARKTR
jgi:hypothetical protein